MLLAALALALEVDPAEVDRLAAELRPRVEQLAGRRLLHLPRAEVLRPADEALAGLLPEDPTTLLGVFYLPDGERLAVVPERLGDRWAPPVREGLLRCEVARALMLALHHQYLPAVRGEDPVRAGHAALVARRACQDATSPDVVAAFDLAAATVVMGENPATTPVAVARRWVAREEARRGREAIWAELASPPTPEAIAPVADALLSDPWEVDAAVTAVGDVLSGLPGQGTRYWPTPLALLTVYGSLDVEVVRSPLLPPIASAVLWGWDDGEVAVTVAAAQLQDDQAASWLQANFVPWTDGRQRYRFPDQGAKGHIERSTGNDPDGLPYATLQVHGTWANRSFHEVWLARADQLYLVRATGGRWRDRDVAAGPAFLAATIRPTSPGGRIRRDEARRLFDTAPAGEIVDAPPWWAWSLEHARRGTDAERADALLAALPRMPLAEVVARVDEARALAELTHRPEVAARVLDRIPPDQLPNRVRFDLVRERVRGRDWASAETLLGGLKADPDVTEGQILDLRVVIAAEQGRWTDARDLALRPEALNTTRLWLVGRATLGRRLDIARAVQAAACAALPPEERRACEDADPELRPGP